MDSFNEYIATLTNQATCIAKILSDMMVNHESYIISSPDGTGKRTVCKQLKITWERARKKTILLSPQALPSEYGVFFSGLSQSTNWGDNVRTLVSNSLKDVPLVGNTLSAIIDMVGKSKTSKKMLSDQAQTVLKLLDSALGRDSLIICENLQLWDTQSLFLLKLLVEHQVDSSILKEASFVLTCDDEQNVALSHIVTNCNCIHLKNVEEEHILSVLRIFNANICISESQLKMLFVISGGNLQILKSCCAFSNDLNGKQITTLYELIAMRVQNDTKIPEEILSLLKAASVIGSESPKELLKAFTAESVKHFLDALMESEKMTLLQETENQIRFEAELIRECLYRNVKGVQEYHLRLGKCIRLLYPSAYQMQAHHLYYGGEFNMAVICYISDLLRNYRESGELPTIQPDTLGELLRGHQYFNIYNKLCNAYKLYYNNDYALAHNLLLELAPDVNEIEFSFEIGYLIALICTNQNYTESDFSYGLDTLERWYSPEFEESHTEMWLRATMLLLDYYYEMGQQEKGARLQREIARVLDLKNGTDKRFQEKRHSLYLKANVYSKVEIAHVKTKKALEYFSHLSNSSFYIQKYYLALLNHSANELVMGRNDSALSLTSEAFALISKFSGISFIKPEILANNYAVSSYLSRKSTAKEVLIQMESYRTSWLEFADELLINSNIVSLLALNGQMQEAYDLSKVLCENLMHHDDVDSYYLYFLLNNLTVLAAIRGDWSRVDKELPILVKTIPLPLDRPYFLARNSYIAELLKNRSFWDSTNRILGSQEALGWNDTMIREHPNTIGDAWPFWGKILLFSDLQDWSDC